MSFGRAMKDLELAEMSGKLVIPKVKDWLAQHDGNPDFGPESIEALVSILSDSANSSRSGRFGASSRGQCLRKQIFTYLGMPIRQSWNPELAAIFMDGHFRHFKWQMVGLEAGAFTHVEVPVSRPQQRLKLSLDAVNADEKWFFELKGVQWVSDDIPESHKLQMTTCMIATGWETASYVQESKVTGQSKEWVYELEADVYVQVKDELDSLNESVDRQVLPPIKKGCAGSRKTKEYHECPFKANCLHQERWPVNAKWDKETKDEELMSEWDED